MLFGSFERSSELCPLSRDEASRAAENGAPSGAGSGGGELGRLFPRIRWLGTAGFVIETAKTTVIIDPYMSRLSLAALAVAPLVADEDAVRARLPTQVDAVLCGHSHFDHLLDAPLIARITGAKLVGSRTTCAFGLAAGLAADQLVEIGPAGGELSIGDLDIRFVPSLHARLLFGSVPFAGEVLPPAPWPARAWQFRMGGAFGILLHAAGVVGMSRAAGAKGAAGVTVYHNGSADLVDAALAGARADVLLVGIVGRKYAPRYVTRLLDLLAPSVVVPAHHDAFFAPLDEGLRLLPGVDLEGFVAEVRSARGSPQIVAPLYDETIGIDPGTGRAFRVR